MDKLMEMFPPAFGDNHHKEQRGGQFLMSIILPAAVEEVVKKYQISIPNPAIAEAVYFIITYLSICLSIS